MFGIQNVLSFHTFFQEGAYPSPIQTSQLSLFHSETQGFWSILKVIPSISLWKDQNVEPNHPK